MSTTDGKTDFSNASGGTDRHTRHLNLMGVRTMAGNEAWDETYRNVQRLDPDGAKTIVLPLISTSNGLTFEVSNWASGVEAITINQHATDGSTLVVSLDRYDRTRIWCDGTAWYIDGVVVIAFT